VCFCHRTITSPCHSLLSLSDASDKCFVFILQGNLSFYNSHRLFIFPSPHMRRTASLCVSILGALVNFALAVQLLSAWRSLKWEPESEWEGSENSWRGGGVKLVWGLLSGYFAANATVCLIGFIGIIKVRPISYTLTTKISTPPLFLQSIPSFVRFYRDYSIADFSFCAFFAVVGTYAAFRTSVRAVLCEELPRQPSLMRELAEMGINLENCELWFERAVLAFMMIMVVLIVVRVCANLQCYNIISFQTKIFFFAAALLDCSLKLLLLYFTKPKLQLASAHALAPAVHRGHTPTHISSTTPIHNPRCRHTKDRR
jgi:hypothetical protein